MSSIDRNRQSRASQVRSSGGAASQTAQAQQKQRRGDTGITSQQVAGQPLPRGEKGSLQQEFNGLRTELFGGDKSKQDDMDHFLRAHPEFLTQVNAGHAWNPSGGVGGAADSASQSAAASSTVGALGAAQPTGASAGALGSVGASLADSDSVDTSALQKAKGAKITTADVKSYLQIVLQERGPKFSDRNLGGPHNLKLWTDAKVQQLKEGIEVAQQFFPNLPPQTLAKLIVAEGAQESTGDPNAGMKPSQHDWSTSQDGAGLGFLQVTPRFCVQDFNNYGTPIKDASGQVVVKPGGKIDLSDPKVNTAMWAWYTRNSVAAGQSLHEVSIGNPGSPVTRDFGNAQWSWLGGPHNDRHDQTTAGGYKDYHDRIKDYYVQSGFGSADEFETLLDTPVAGTLMNTQFDK